MRMRFSDTVTLYDVTEDGYGDKTLDEGTEVPAAFEQIISKPHGDNQDAIVSSSRLYLPADDEFLVSRGYRLEGLLAKVNVLEGVDTQQFFRITTVSPIRDTLLNNEVTHVECDLDKSTDFTEDAIS